MGVTTWTIATEWVTVPVENVPALTDAVHQLLDFEDVAGVYADLGFAVTLPKEGGFAVSTYDDGEPSDSEVDELLALLAAHALPARVDWVMTNEHGATWIHQFKAGVYQRLEATVVPNAVIEGVVTARALLSWAVPHDAPDEITKACDALDTAISDLPRRTS